MVAEDLAVLARAEDLGEALQQIKDRMDPGEFRHLLTECNATIRQITGIEYGTICAPPECGCSCGGKC